MRCSNRDALEPSQRELVDEVLAPVQNLDAPVLTRNNGGSFNAKLVSAGLEPFSPPKAALQATRAEPEEAPVAAPETRSPKRPRRGEEQTPEPQPLTLEATVARYNQGASGEQPDAFNKLPEAMQPLSQPPFSALNISANNPLFPLPTITLGGLRVNEKTGAVRNTQGQDIAGLYAAGRSAIGVASNNYVSGLSIADCLWSGRRTGRTLAALATGRS